MALEISIDDGTPRAVALTRVEHGDATLWIDGRRHRARLRSLGDAFEIVVDDRTERIWLAVDRDAVFVHAFGRSWRAEVSDPAIRSALQGDQDDLATAPMPGIVIAVSVAPGEAVSSGQPLVVIESMKMQSEIVAWRDGVVERVHLQVGDSFDRGAGLIGLASVDGEEPE